MRVSKTGNNLKISLRHDEFKIFQFSNKYNNFIKQFICQNFEWNVQYKLKQKIFRVFLIYSESDT